MERQGSMLMQRYEVGKLLGQGTFAKVYHARNLKTNMSVAVKIVDKEKIYKAGMIDQIKREISVMRLVTHPNIVQLYEVMASKTKIFFVMEYVKGGELFNKVAKGKLKEDAAKKYFQQLISAVDFCHSRGVYHRDLKPENLLLDENGNLKVSDFGLSALAESKRQDGLLHTTCGTPAYVAPEVINRRGYDGSKADIWSCGVILYVLLAGYLPFHDSNLMEMYRKIGKAEFKFPNWISPDARKLISKMLDPDPNTRISISKIMENSWFRKGFQSKMPRTDAYSKNSNIETEKETAIDADATLKTDLDRLTSLNAFDIISLSAGFDLSGLFEENDRKRELRFTSNQPAKNIISKMEDLAKQLKLKIMKKDGGLLKFEGSKAGRKGVLSIEAEIFEIAPDFHLVEMKKTNGDTLEFQKMMKQDVRPSLKDIVWTWQSDQPLADRQLELSESEPSQIPQLQDHSP
ncbi:CBL-interacting protein kinase 2-like [Primulina tabacum]|uniref:CBL-interacting protein kinase 2-like n=1 Tax=Primulina tabacum TaxID=48773 RepID=UPI003F59D8C2